jgi:lysophospholipase L1-like esterase
VPTLRVLFIALASALYIFLFCGFVFHSNVSGVVFGRYTPLYSCFLGSLAILFVPYLRFLFFLSKTTSFQSSSGEMITLSVWTKFKVIACLLLLGIVPCELVLHHKATRRSRKKLAKYHPFLQNQGRPNRKSLHINEHGFRGEKISLKKDPKTLRIFFMGGSTVYCMRTKYESSHPRILEKKLIKRYPKQKIELQNSGQDWYSTQHTLINYLFRIKDFDPDIIILFHGINDLCRSFTPEKLSHGEFRSDYGHYYGSVSRYVLGHYQAFNFPHPYTVAWLSQDFMYSDFFLPKAVPVNEFPSLKSFDRNLRSIITILRADKVRLILATQPFIYRNGLSKEEKATLWMDRHFCETKNVFPDVPSLAKGMTQFNDRTKQLAKEHGAPLIDLTAQIPQTKDYFLDDVHFTQKANEKIAEIIFKFFEEHNIIK